ncbi:type VI secretion system baseplate subunit TssG [Acinetobacter indicus]|uniref:type VI secretion system baseplate subunit TssG n=1 Tax=Acinetobacter indicus TaxID=756892 RepID=UPI003215B1CC
MRAERWWQETSVIADLVEQPTAYEFIQATRLLRHAPEQAKQADWKKGFQFQTSLNLNFPAAEIETLAVEDDQIQLTNLMVGLTGIPGALPYTYTQRVRQSPRIQREETVQFLSLFNNKLTGQYIEASLAYNLPVRYEVEHDNHYLDILHALNGYIRSQHEQDEMDHYFAEFSGLMQGQNNTAHALKTVLNCIFKTDFTVHEFIEEKFKLNDAHKTCLGGSNPALLGVNTFCGETIRQIDGKIEIEVGPLNRQQYQEFLPGQPASTKLKKLLQTWCSPTLMVDLRLVLSKEDIQPLCLNSSHHAGLGQGAFLMPQARADNRDSCYPLLGDQR